LRRLAWNKVPPLFVTPGIRDSAAEKNDQASVAPPEQAVLAGSTHLVIGRPITGAAEGGRAEAAKRFLKRIRDTYGEGRVLAPHS
jgi:orotidine-5'-phosphate decarboxylase